MTPKSRLVGLGAPALLAVAFVLRLPHQVPLSALQQAAPDSIILESALGNVLLTHAAHATMTDCETCHHASRPEKPGTGGAYQKCTDCHTKKQQAPMRTTLQAAFHDNRAKTGTCIDCHVKEASAGKTVPTECAGCHRRQRS